MSKKVLRNTSILVCLVFMLTLLESPLTLAAGGKGKGGGNKTGSESTTSLDSSTEGIKSSQKGGSSKGGNGDSRGDGTGGGNQGSTGAGNGKDSGTTSGSDPTELNPTVGSVSGTITNNTDMAMSGVTVTLYPGQYNSTTDAQGNYTISDVPIGTYKIFVSAEDYNDSDKTVSIANKKSSNVNFVLDPVSSEISINSLTATPDSFVEETETTISLTAEFEGNASKFQWTQMKGPKVPLNGLSANEASADVSGLSVAVDVELIFRLTLTDSDGNYVFKDVSVFVEAANMYPFLGPNVQIGGATTAVEKFDYNGNQWAIFNIGSKLSTAQIDTKTKPESVNSISVPGFIRHIEVVTYNDTNYALLSCGDEGINVVNINDPNNIFHVSNVNVEYYKDGLTFAEGGGDLLYDEVISGNGFITELATDGVDLFIANVDYGIHKTSLSNLLDAAGPVLTENKTLLVEQEKFTLQYAGEKPWGGPVSLKLSEGKIFASLGFLGLGIFDTTTLDQVGGYNLYTDTSVTEDWFIDLDIKEKVQKDPDTGELFLDAFTGMPDYRQASFELLDVMKNRVVAPTPWADFDRYGRYYYEANSVDIAEFEDRTIAYIAYSLGGLIAVDITGYQDTSSDNFMNAKYLGYFPGVPANGRDDVLPDKSKSILPHYGAGGLKEAGIVDVQVSGNYVYATDHFAGLIIVDKASTPDIDWKGPEGYYNNDEDGILGNHYPDYEFITSFDMSPWDPDDHESMPKWMYQSPCLLVTQEVNGHGNSLLLMDDISVNTAGNVDVLICSGAGGFNFVDIVDLEAPTMDERYDVPVYFPPTNEIGALPNGNPGQTISIGHAQGIDASENYLYVADGPHGISAWKLLDDEGYATDDVRLVANTVQDEYAVIVDGVEIHPATHAVNILFDPINNVAWANCSSIGLRRVDVKDVENGTAKIGDPILLSLSLTDCFEHSAEWGNVEGIQFQDHSYDVVIKGDYAFTADGNNGITVYDITKDPTDPNSGFFVSNIGAGKQKAPLGKALGLDLWTDSSTNRSYAFVASGPRGVGVVDVTDVNNMEIIKVFEPIKYEHGDIGGADGKCNDVNVVGDHLYLAYDDFGVVCYSLADMIRPLPEGTSPTEVWNKGNKGQLNWDYRPVELSCFKLDIDGEALRMDYTQVNGKTILYVAYGTAGVVKIDFTDPTNPILKEIAPTIDECMGVTISNGRLYAADGDGGLIFFK